MTHQDDRPSPHEPPVDSGSAPRSSRRDVVVTAALGFVGVGALLAAWPLVRHLAPHPGSPRPETATVDLTKIAEGQTITVPWRQLPVFVRHRSVREISEAEREVVFNDPQARNAALPANTRATDANRTLAQHRKWLVVIGLCTRPDCVLRDAGDLEFGNGRVRWFCPCCASRYDASGRIMTGPARENLAVPVYAIRGQELVIG